jgi:hypothetical protein
MNKRKKITVMVESKDDAFGTPRTIVRTYNQVLGEIYFLEDDNYDFKYFVVKYCNPTSFYEESFDTELEAVKFICQEEGLTGKYESIPLRYGFYANSESGAISFQKPIDLAA